MFSFVLSGLNKSHADAFVQYMETIVLGKGVLTGEKPLRTFYYLMESYKRICVGLRYYYLSAIKEKDSVLRYPMVTLGYAKVGSPKDVVAVDTYSANTNVLGAADGS